MKNEKNPTIYVVCSHFDGMMYATEPSCMECDYKRIDVRCNYCTTPIDDAIKLGDYKSAADIIEQIARQKHWTEPIQEGLRQYILSLDAKTLWKIESTTDRDRHVYTRLYCLCALGDKGEIY